MVMVTTDLQTVAVEVVKKKKRRSKIMQGSLGACKMAPQGKLKRTQTQMRGPKTEPEL